MINNTNKIVSTVNNVSDAGKACHLALITCEEPGCKKEYVAVVQDMLARTNTVIGKVLMVYGPKHFFCARHAHQGLVYDGHPISGTCRGIDYSKDQMAYGKNKGPDKVGHPKRDQKKSQKNSQKGSHKNSYKSTRRTYQGSPKNINTRRKKA